MAFLVNAFGFLLCLMICCCPVFSNTAFANIQQELLARIEFLEVQGREQAKILVTQANSMKQMEFKLDMLTAKIETQQQTIERYQQRENALEQRVEELETGSNKHRAEPEGTKDTGNDNQFGNANTQPIGGEVDKVPMSAKKPFPVNGQTVAFHAVIAEPTEISNLKIGEIIIFPDVLTNFGEGYNNETGVFTAPVGGIYILSISMMSYNTGLDNIYVHMKKNLYYLANVFAHSDSEHANQGSVTVVTELAVGDNVTVTLFGPQYATSYGGYYDTFMGCLIFPTF